MLKINLLTERRDAEREYRKMQQGNPIVDHLVMHLDTTVRRRVNQNTRNHKKMVVKRAAKIRCQQQRRGAKTFAPWLGTLGGPTIGVSEKKPLSFKNEVVARFSRCLQCGTEFVDEKGRATLSGFAFCGETATANGNCKQEWLAVHPETSELGKLTAPPEPTPIAFEHHKKSEARSIRGKKLPLRAPRLKLRSRQLVNDGNGIDQLAT
jgi:hypothetical protein